MKPFSILLLLLLYTAVCFGQRPLTHSRVSSYYTYFFPLKDADMDMFYGRKKKEIDDRILTRAVDSVLTDHFAMPKLPPGNYLKAYALKSAIRYELLEVHNAYLRLLDNQKDFRFLLVDETGREINDADVHLNNTRINYDAALHEYVHARANKEAVLTVKYNGVTNYFKVDGRIRYSYSNTNVWRQMVYRWRRLPYTFPLKYVYQPLHRIFTGQAGHNTGSKYTGYMAFNKPMYKPGDTVKFKAFIFRKSGRQPVKQKTLLVQIHGGYREKGKTIGTVNSYRDGAFESSFVLNDSLKLYLDENYTISLGEKQGKDSDFVEFQDGSFRYEDYELKSVKFLMRTDKSVSAPGDPVAVYLKATDENDLPVSDGRVELTLTTWNVNTRYGDRLFIPDTLWKHKVPLEPVGETKVLLPDSIFPNADLSYRINAVFLNSDNQRRQQQETLTYKDQAYRFQYNLEHDTLSVSYLVRGKERQTTAAITGLRPDGDSLPKRIIHLPAKLVVNHETYGYKLKTDSLTDVKYMYDYSADITCSGYRTADSLFVQVQNPRHVPLWYTVFSGNRIIDAGMTVNLFYKREYHHKGNVFFRVNYLWAGNPQHNEIKIEYQDKILNLTQIQPAVVYPGQTVALTVVAKDGLGRALADVDLTAWAVTKKFNTSVMPFVPYFARFYAGRKMLRYIQTGSVKDDAELGLNWKRWGRDMGLDSITYFKFTHPDTNFSIAEPAPDGITQIAPFIVRYGEILSVYELFIDNRPVYFSQAGQLPRYSFAVDSGKHNLRFRLLTRMITIDSVMVPKGRKLIFSINADRVFDDPHFSQKVPDSLSKYEADLINAYMANVVNNFRHKMAWLQSGDTRLLLNPYPAASRYNAYDHTGILAGPLPFDAAHLTVKNDTNWYFLNEPGYSFRFDHGLIKEKEIRGRYPFFTHLGGTVAAMPDYKQYVLTGKEIDFLWLDYLDNRSYNTMLFRNDNATTSVAGSLNIAINGYAPDNIPPAGQPMVKNIILYRYDNPDYIRIYPGRTDGIQLLQAGNYRIFFLLKGNRYFIQEQVHIRPYGTNFVRIKFTDIKPADNVSLKIDAVISKRDEDDEHSNNETDKQQLKETFNATFTTNAHYTGVMTGRVIGDDNEPIPGASVMVRGTKFGTQTNVEGYFRVNVPLAGKLTFNFIGYERTEIDINPGTNVQVKLKPVSQNLQEVVVVGYGTASRRDLTRSLAPGDLNAVLQGKMAGVEITDGTPGAVSQIRIRGVSSAPQGTPLYVVDGVPIEGTASLNPSDIADISILKDAAATAIYGARGANGVVIITTRKGPVSANGAEAALLPQTQTLRTRFSDYAYWQPRLHTDANGVARFNVTFPDDITNWQTAVVGVAGDLTGTAQGQIKSFKPLSANLVTPQFAVKGDEISVIGKVMNYGKDTVSLERSFTYNGSAVKNERLLIKNSRIDTFKVAANGSDSLKFEYTIKKDNGYFDGERRSIPVFEPGVQETKGTFANLEKDTTINLSFDPALGKVTFRAEASVLPVLRAEAEHLRNYEYLCNEQLASKLHGLLAEKRICKALNEPFRYDRNIRDIIRKLQDSRRPEGTWGWWKDSEEELWISLHALKALIEAQQEGYTVQLDRQKVIDYLIYKLSAYNGANKLDALEILLNIEAKVDYKVFIAAYEQQVFRKKDVSAYDMLRLMLIKQQAGISFSMDSLLQKRHNTMFGNLYWGEPGYHFFNNSIQFTVLAYRILRAEGKHNELLPKIRNYLLEQRTDGYWRNTYESSLILDAILPDVLVNNEPPKTPSVTLSGGKSALVKTFPYTTTLDAGASLRVSKTGNLPVYITAYQQFRNPQPQKISKDFTVNTWFEKSGEKITQLKGGEQVKLNAEVIARGDADYVMIEVPIPAGCSYETHEQNLTGEVHREYFKNKVVIFCRKLTAGKYNFSIRLVPRYGGVYTLNPAKAEMMYFPVFYGREGMKKVSIN